MKWIGLAVLAALAVGCSSGANRADPTPAAATCAFPPHTYDDLEACKGDSQQIELKVADSYDGKTTARIAITSKDPRTIVAAMGAYAAEWSAGADSFTVFAYGSESDYRDGGGYNRGRIFWNNGGPITVDVCTAFDDSQGVATCSKESSYMVTNR